MTIRRIALCIAVLVIAGLLFRQCAAAPRGPIGSLPLSDDYIPWTRPYGLTSDVAEVASDGDYLDALREVAAWPLRHLGWVGIGLLLVLVVGGSMAQSVHYRVGSHPRENPFTGFLWVGGLLLGIGAVVLASGAILNSEANPLVFIGLLAVVAVAFWGTMNGSLSITSRKGTAQYRWGHSRVTDANTKVFVALVLVLAVVFAVIAKAW